MSLLSKSDSMSPVNYRYQHLLDKEDEALSGTGLSNESSLSGEETSTRLSSSVDSNIGQLRPVHLSKGNLIKKWQKKIGKGIDLDPQQIEHFRLDRKDRIIRGLLNKEISSASTTAVLNRIRRLAIEGSPLEKVRCVEILADVTIRLEQLGTQNKDGERIREYYLGLATEALRSNGVGKLSSQEVRIVHRLDSKLGEELARARGEDPNSLSSQSGFGQIRLEYERQGREFLEAHLVEQYKMCAGQKPTLLQSKELNHEYFDRICRSLDRPDIGKSLKDVLYSMQHRFLNADQGDPVVSTKRLQQFMARGARGFVERYAQDAIRSTIESYAGDKTTAPLRDLLPRPYLMIELERRSALGDKSVSELIEAVRSKGGEADVRYVEDMLYRVTHKDIGKEGNPLRHSETQPQRKWSEYMLLRMRDETTAEKLFDESRQILAMAGSDQKPQPNLIMYARKVYGRLIDDVSKGNVQKSVKNYYTGKCLQEMNGICRLKDKEKMQAIQKAKSEYSDEDLWLMLKLKPECGNTLGKIFGEKRVVELCDKSAQLMRNQNKQKRIEAAVAHLDQGSTETLRGIDNIASMRRPVDKAMLEYILDRLEVSSAPRILTGVMQYAVHHLNSGDWHRELAGLKHLQWLERDPETFPLLQKFAATVTGNALKRVDKQDGATSLRRQVPREILVIEWKRRLAEGTAKELLDQIQSGCRSDDFAFASDLLRETARKNPDLAERKRGNRDDGLSKLLVEPRSNTVTKNTEHRAPMLDDQKIKDGTPLLKGYESETKEDH